MSTERRLTGQHLRLLSDIEQLARNAGYCYATNYYLRTSVMSSMYCRSERTIQRYLRVLADNDMIRIELRGPVRNIYVTERGAMVLRAAGFSVQATPTDCRPRQIADPVKTPFETSDCRGYPDRMTGLPRQNDTQIYIYNNDSHMITEPQKQKKGESEMENEQRSPMTAMQTEPDRLVAQVQHEPERPRAAVQTEPAGQPAVADQTKQAGAVNANPLEELRRYHEELEARREAERNRTVTEEERAALLNWLKEWSA